MAAQRAEQAIAQQRVAPEDRELVRTYFKSIRPGQ
jgi:hypothetical protein